ncbi:MAG: hypothetical protein JWR38_5240 [Mucilaginibacter sp.]|nr:hypothetical protein [Mucilaginibacter sp.]
MAQIPPIEDTYIDDIIKTQGVYNPNLNKTQGIKLRELVKLLRDRLEQEAAGLSDGKVDKQTGYQLSQENYSPEEKSKLGGLREHFRGYYVTVAALTAAVSTGTVGDYAFVDQGAAADAQLYIWDSNDNKWVLSSAGGSIAEATEQNPGIIALATIAQALARTDDERAMTALKTISLILDEKKLVSYQIAPVSLNEVSILMENAGQVNSALIAGASNLKLKAGLSGIYPSGNQVYPFAYVAGDRVFMTYNYDDLNNASCNIKLKCKDN